MTEEIQTKRLILRQWRDSDLEPFAELNADKEVMTYFPKTLTQCESDLMLQRCKATIERNGWGFWAVELKNTHDFIGFVGLNKPAAKLPFNPCVEVGWRLSKKYWGQGYATEAAQTALTFAFECLSVAEVVSFTPIQNKPSQSVMKKIGMTDTRQNFAHPQVPLKSILRENVLFKITKQGWQNTL